MNFSERDYDRAERLAEQEREAGIARARTALMGEGRPDCVDCDDEIEATRRRLQPSAIRCTHCQQLRDLGIKR